jgi:hypothetical protein
VAPASDQPREQRTANRSGVKAAASGDEARERLKRGRWPLRGERHRHVDVAQRAVDPDERRVAGTLRVGVVIDPHPYAARAAPGLHVGGDPRREAAETHIGKPRLGAFPDEVPVQLVIHGAEQVRKLVQWLA